MNRICAVFVAISLLAAVPVTAQDSLSLPEQAFEHLWQTFDKTYGIFAPKNIDWDAVYDAYRPNVTPSTTDDELFEIMTSMLGHLNDHHVGLFTGRKAWKGGVVGEMTMDDFSLDLITSNYITGNHQTAYDGRFTYGWLSDRVGYFHFSSFSGEDGTAAAMDSILALFADARAIICDVRNNGGGSDAVGQIIANRFADRRRLYMITHRKGGAAHDAFDPPRYWFVQPDGQYRFHGPVILLTHRFSISAAENLALAMRTLLTVTVVGETTCGVMADVYGFQLPNGWFVHCAYKRFTDHKGFCWEGIGIPPDLRITNSAEDIENGHDRVLEFALDLAQNADLSPRERATESATGDLRSLADDVLAATSTAQIDELISHADHDSRYYMNPYERAVAGAELARQGRVDEAVTVLMLDTSSFPSHWRGHFTLGNVLLGRGDTARAKMVFARSMDVNPQLFPWQRDDYKTAERVLNDIIMIERILERVVDDP